MTRVVSAVVHVYRARTRPDGGVPALLDAVERDRMASLRRPQDRDRYVTAHLLMRAVLAEHSGVPVAAQRFARHCAVCGGPHGKPTLVTEGSDPSRGPHVSLSYAGEHVVVAVSDAQLGVDAELWATTDFAGFAAVALTAQEAAELSAFRLPDRAWARATWWARKEATLKATGHGLRVEAPSLRVTAPDRAPALLDWTDPEVPRPTVALADAPVGDGVACAVARLGSESVIVRLSESGALLDRLSPPGG